MSQVPLLQGFKADHISDSIVLGFQLFCVLVNAFCPNTEFEPLVRTFLRRFEDDEDNSVIIMANCKLLVQPDDAVQS